jgi:hypothetical protein
MASAYCICDACGIGFSNMEDYATLTRPEDMDLCRDCSRKYLNEYEMDSDLEDYVACRPYSDNRMLIKVRDFRREQYQDAEIWFQKERQCNSWWKGERCAESIDGRMGTYCWKHICKWKGCEHECFYDRICRRCDEKKSESEKSKEENYKTEEEFHQEIKEKNARYTYD